MVLKFVPYPPDADLKRQGIALPDSKRPGQTAVYASAWWPSIQPTDYGVHVLADVFESGLSRGPQRALLGSRPRIPHSSPAKLERRYVWQSYGEVDARRRDLGSALYTLFRDGTLGGGDLPTIGVWMVNRSEWQIVDFAAHLYGLVSVALYDTLGPDAVEYVINHSEITVVFASEAHMPTVLNLAGQKCPKLRMIVCVDSLEPQARNALNAWGKEKGVKIVELAELEEQGRKARVEPPKVVPEQVYSICYTSGTTGNPKGAVLTHKSTVAAVSMWCHGVPLDEKDITVISYLPLAHIYGRIIELFITAVGGRIGYFSGDTQMLLDDLQILRPNYLPTVPRVINKIYAGIANMAKQPGLKGAMLRTAIQAKLQRFHATGDWTHPVWDRLVFRKVQQVAGGRIEGLACGSAPVAKDAYDLMKVAFAAMGVEGYGMTETNATITRTMPQDPEASGIAGSPHAFNHVKLVDVPSMGYSAEDKPYPRGELCVKGENCIKEYYKDAENTKKLIDEDGWLHTGDIASVDEVGRFRIIDRVKNIMKLAQGEYVGLERVENCYSACSLLQQVYVHGNSLREYLVGIVIPEPAPFVELVHRATNEKINPDDRAAMERAARDPRVVERVLQELDKEAKHNGLKGFEQIRNIHIELDPFTVENGLLTPTFKARRADVDKKYGPIFEGLYAAGIPARSAKGKGKGKL
ncbi:acetyl-CoA synthetase-like protein [Exidia glandulosa HHB12029]|uniref:Acetyl-CoA synthetase-like protein n=1 Tax=Exidia glandulosa HHB12029 TaxID=1314781 RepID=A0A165BVV0_EXIGL|nr:acetyl-CoA synthetase-like protein [Exidia glandulosa HHB12029]